VIKYAWYSPDLDVIVLQTFIDGCAVSFEWDWTQMVEALHVCSDEDPMNRGLWIPLGEL